MLRNSLAHVARGSDAVCFFQWRASRAGAEKFHSALVPHAGTDTKVWREVVELGAVLGSIAEVAGSTVRGEVAVVVDWDARWAAELDSHPSADVTYLDRHQALYRALWDAGVTTDMVAPGRRPVGLPARARADPVPHHRRRCREPRPGTSSPAAPPWSPTGAASSTRTTTSGSAATPAPSATCSASAPRSSARCARTSSPARRRGARRPVGRRLDRAAARCAVPRPSSTYADGPLPGVPALTRHTAGGGTAWYLATRGRRRGHRRAGAPPLRRRPASRRRTRPGVEMVRRTGDGTSYLFVINHTDAAAEVAGDRAPTRDRRRPALGTVRSPPAAWPWCAKGRCEVLARERQSYILERVRTARRRARQRPDRGAPRVSDMTVRRDLDLLAAPGSAGQGARGCHRPGREQHRRAGLRDQVGPRAGREGRHRGAGGRRWSAPGCAVGLSAGTTTWTLAHRLLDVRGITVVTNSVRDRDRLLPARRDPDQTIVLTGGRAHAVRRPGRPGGGGDAAVTEPGHASSSACTAWTSTPASPARTSWRPRRTAPWPAPPADWPWSPTTPSGASSASARIAALHEADVVITDSGLARRRPRVLTQQVGDVRLAPVDEGAPAPGSGDVMRRTPTRLADGRELIYFDSDATRRARPHHRGRPARPRAHGDRVGDPARRGARRVGGDRLPPPGPHPPAARRRVPAVPVPRRPAHRDPGRRLRRRRLREPVPVASAEDADPDFDRRPSERRPGLGRCEVRLLHQRPRHRAEPAAAGAGAPGAGRLDRPHRGAGSPPVRRAGVLLREPRARRSASRWATRTGRSTATRSSRRAPARMLDAARRYRERTGRRRVRRPAGRRAGRGLAGS